MPKSQSAKADNKVEDSTGAKEEADPCHASPKSSFVGGNFQPAKSLRTPSLSRSLNQDLPVIHAEVQDLHKTSPRLTRKPHGLSPLSPSTPSPITMTYTHRHTQSSSSIDENEQDQSNENVPQAVLDSMIADLNQPRSTDTETVHARAQQLQPARKVLRRAPPEKSPSGAVSLTVNAELRDAKTGLVIKPGKKGKGFEK